VHRAEPQTEIGVFNVEAVGADDGRVDTSHAGALRMLLESHHQFDYVDERADWDRYRVLVFPDKVPFDEALTDRVRAFLEGGGKVLATYRSGLHPDGGGFALDEFGVTLVGDAPYEADYLRPLPALGADLEYTEYVMYERGLAVQPGEGTRILAETVGPYFDRAWDHFCSHRQTPMDPANPQVYPAATINAQGNVIYMAHPLFVGYRRQAPLWYKRLVLAALGLLLPEPLVITDAPSSAQITLLRQPQEGRTVLHLLHYIPERRGLEFDTIEDVIPLYNVGVRFRAATAPARVYLAPQGEALEHVYEDGYVHVTVPRVMGHQMVVADD
jgi:hypothetical protein